MTALQLSHHQGCLHSRSLGASALTLHLISRHDISLWCSGSSWRVPGCAPQPLQARGAHTRCSQLPSRSVLGQEGMSVQGGCVRSSPWTILSSSERCPEELCSAPFLLTFCLSLVCNGVVGGKALPTPRAPIPGARSRWVLAEGRCCHPALLCFLCSAGLRSGSGHLNTEEKQK